MFTEERANAQATLAAMGRSARDLQADSAQAAASADAVLYLFTRGLHLADLSTVLRFLGPAVGNMTPLRAFGILSRADEYWPPERNGSSSAYARDLVTYDPMATATAIAERYLAEPDIGSTFYTILPVAGILGIGAKFLTADELTWLHDLSGVDLPVLMRSLPDVGRFARAAELPGIARHCQVVGRRGRCHA
jgi:hypothetical protein